MRVIEKADIAPLEPLLCSIQAGTAIIARSERFIIDAIARGELEAVKSDRRTLLVVQSLKTTLPACGTGSARREHQTHRADAWPNTKRDGPASWETTRSRA
jgi:hypothetical protein